MGITANAVPNHWAFIFRVLGFHYPVVERGQVLCSKLVLPCKDYRLLLSCCIKWPFGYWVRWLPYIGIIVLLKLILCNQGGTASTFLSRLVCHILNLADMHGITLIPAYTPSHVEPGYLSHSSGSILTLGSTRGGSIGILMYQSMSASLCRGISITSESLRVEHFQ